MSVPAKGARARLVSHPVFGEGEVVDTRWRGTELLVRFQSGLRLWLPVGRVRLLVNVSTFKLEQAVAE
ncbi:hypothetical protein FJY71_05415, partial [candidate division WOR-3 bacterium]|nr:hypothetical protein [candidate division WOR-3 bacterium]